MQNDLDLIRLIMETVRDREHVWPKKVEVSGYPELVVARHVERLHDDGYLEGPKHHPGNDPVAQIKVKDLTSKGHQFLAALEAEDVWARLKSALKPSELGALSMAKLAGIAGELAERALRKKLGLD